MSTVPTWKICRKCGRPYSYNPSVGEYGCPECLKMKKRISDKIRFLCGRMGNGKNER